MDLYTEIPDGEPMDLIHSPFGGRYCGQIPPRRRVSLFRSSVIGFFTDKNTTEEILFQGSYLFFKDGKFLQIKQDPSIGYETRTKNWLFDICK